MKKKGFTLIELLAVIVILAVIALIATPAVLNIIEDSKRSAAEASARNIVSAAKSYYMQKIMEDIEIGNIDLSNSELTYEGDKATKGNLSYDANGNVSGKMYISGYCIEVDTDGAITSTKTSEDKCEIGPTEITYEDGNVVYFDVKNGVKCNESDYHSDNSKTGYNGINTTTSNQNGCLKFYSFNYDGGNTINLILDHNTTGSVLWVDYDTFNPGPEDLLNQLKSDTDSWKGTLTPTTYQVKYYKLDYANYKARIITADEIAKITNNTNFNFDDYEEMDYYFSTHSSKQSTTCQEGNISGCKYGWLYDRTATISKDFGALNNSDTDIRGYWTITYSYYGGRLDYAWAVGVEDNLIAVDIINEWDYGVRPVIEVNKDKLK